MSHITKLVLRIVINRIRGRTLQEVSPEQYEFTPDKGTMNAIFVLKRLVERSVEKQKYVYNCFIDYSKAFDTVNHDSLVELLQSLDVDDSDTRLLTNLYWTQTAAVRCDKDLSDWMSSKQGVRQGCVASPHLFALYTKIIMREIEDMEGFRFGGKVVNNIRYADVTVILGESEQQLQQLINTVITESELKGLYLNSTKSFTMVFLKAKVNPACSVSVHGNVLGQVQSFVYLGSLFRSDARSDKEIRRRIGIAKSTFTSMNTILTARNITIAVCLRVLKCCICYRRMLRISWKEKVTNVEVYRRMNTSTSLLIDIVHN